MGFALRLRSSSGDGEGEGDGLAVTWVTYYLTCTKGRLGEGDWLRWTVRS
jgi:hypothetical protein